MRRIAFVVFTSLAVWAGACIAPHRHENRHEKKDCKERCKGLKGQDRADCNKRCN